MSEPWYNVVRVRQPGSVVLAEALPALRAENERRRAGVHGPRAVTNGTMSMREFSDWVSTLDSRSTLTERNSMAIGAVYACVALIGGAIASMPLKFYREGAHGREEYRPDEWWLLNEQPMTCWAAAPAWEYAAWSLLLQADSFWRIRRASRLSPKIVGFEPLHPRTVDVFRLEDRLAYRVSSQPSQLIADTVTLDQDDVLHIPGPGFDGLRGLSQIRYALSAAGSIALQADQYAGSFFANGSRPDFALQTDAPMKPEQVEALREQISEGHRGAAAAFKPMVLSGGLKVQPITMTAADSQLVEQRRFQVEDIARIFGVPPHMIGHTDKTTSWGSGVEQMSIAFVKYTLQRHLVKFEQEINRKVFRYSGRFCEFATAGLERGDHKTRHEAYRIALGRAGEPAWMTVNEVRALENLPPIDGGDRLVDSTPQPAKQGMQ